ncbi:hypothetical protein Acr_00g0070090 [Actinidia rufa]|uniref:PPIase cyclophilin-type domain-containing protein n=1 Tax=Actinidia rufa TaxID=165716 RepID=A0A7J0DR40_9ERIC|nr:hypothetical protein Acr_00g0070090 [Actinidia rufa]
MLRWQRKIGSSLAVEKLQDEWERLVAKGGKLEIDKEEVGKDPNGTAFTIATRDSPELDMLALVVGRVLEGTEVVQRIGQVAKLIGDKRTLVAARGFNRPYLKVVVSNCGLLE